MIKLKPISVTYVHLVRNGEIQATIPVVSSQDLETAKEILLRYLAALDDPETYSIQVLTKQNVSKSLI